MASAFELSLMNMTERLQKLTETSEKKDHELLTLRNLIESLNPISNRCPLTSVEGGTEMKIKGSINIGRSNSATASPAHFQNTLIHVQGIESRTEYNSLSGVALIASSESCNSLNSTTVTPDINGDQLKKQQNKGWFRSSLGKAFRKKPKLSDVSMSDVETDYYTAHSAKSKDENQQNILREVKSPTIENLKQQLDERDLKLTDAQLEALSSAHQLEQLKELLISMRYEMSTLRADNERLQKMVQIDDGINNNELLISNSSENSNSDGRKSVVPENIRDNEIVQSKAAISHSDNFNHLFKFSCQNEISVGTFVNIDECTISGNVFHRVVKRITIGSCHISKSTTWQQLERQIMMLFKEYLSFIDPFANLGINCDCIEQFKLGSTLHTLPPTENCDDTNLRPPIDHIDGRSNTTDINQIQVTIRCCQPQNSLIDALAFDTLIPKTVLQRYVSLLLEHRLLILCGPSGTGKSYLATKLAQHLIDRHGQEVSPSTLAIFTVDQKSNKELRSYLASIADQSQTCATNGNTAEPVDKHRKPPMVVVLDNLHHVNSLAEIFDSFLSSNVISPYVIGTMTQASFSNTNLQTHHNFRWVLCANHMEPVKGFLGRYLRRKLIKVEWEEGRHNETLMNTVEWISKVWQHINKFLESHSSSDVTIGPRLFLSCPMSIEGSQIWFTDLWNYSLVPYLLEAVREGLQTFGRRSKWEDPVDWILETWPWAHSAVKTRNSDPSCLIRLRPEDVGYDSQVPVNSSLTSPSRLLVQNSLMVSQGSNNSFIQDPRISMLSSSMGQRSSSPHHTYSRTDPIFNMLIKLQDSATLSVGSLNNENEIATTKSNSLSRVASSSSSTTV